MPMISRPPVTTVFGASIGRTAVHLETYGSRKWGCLSGAITRAQTSTHRHPDQRPPPPDLLGGTSFPSADSTTEARARRGRFRPQDPPEITAGRQLPLRSSIWAGGVALPSSSSTAGVRGRRATFRRSFIISTTASLVHHPFAQPKPPVTSGFRWPGLGVYQ